MKKEVSSEWSGKFVEFTSKEDINSSASLNTPGFTVPEKVKFSLVKAGKITMENLEPFEGVLVQLESGRQLPISSRVFLGNYFEVVKKDDKPVFDANGKVSTTPKSIDTPFRNSGLNIFDFVEQNHDTVFIGTKPVKYSALVFGTNDVVKEKTQMTYKVIWD
jgi:hypothetical protein